MLEFFWRKPAFPLSDIHGDARGGGFDLLKQSIMLPPGINALRGVDDHHGKTHRPIPNLQIFIPKLHIAL